jgi:D-aminoacyl-tRNA deacylase
VINLRAVIQRVLSSQVEVEGKVVGKINEGLNVLLGIANTDTLEDVLYMKDKIINLRIFEDSDEKMNRSLLDVKGELLIISQFTLYGNCKKGRRPNFMEALSGEAAEVLYEAFVNECKREVSVVQTGSFGAMMKVEITNNGPVTLIVESR